MQLNKNELMERLPYQQKILLIAMALLIGKTDALYLSMQQIQGELKWVCSSLHINYNPQVLEESLREIEQYGFVIMKKKNNETKIVLNIGVDEIKSNFQEN